jgi:hypothetical protein
MKARDAVLRDEAQQLPGIESRLRNCEAAFADGIEPLGIGALGGTDR